MTAGGGGVVLAGRRAGKQARVRGARSRQQPGKKTPPVENVIFLKVLLRKLERNIYYNPTLRTLGGVWS